MRELVWMHDGRMRALYSVVAPITYILANVNRAANSPPSPYHDFNPYAKRETRSQDIVINNAEEAKAVWKSWGVRV